MAVMVAEKDVADLKKAVEQKALWNDLRDELFKRLRPLFIEAIVIGAELGRTQKPARERRRRAAKLLRGYRAGQAVAVETEAEWLTTTAETYVAGYMDTWWAGLRETAAEALRQSILRAIANGTGAPGVIKDIDGIFSKQRASLIAVTEVTRLMGHGAQLQYTRVGFAEWEWKTANDRRVDPICAAKAASGPYPMSTAFDPAHPRCRCWPVPSGKPEPKKAK